MVNAKLVGIVAALLLVTAIVSFKLAATVERMRQKSAMASPIAAMLREIVKEMKSGDQEHAVRMTERLERGLTDYLHERGPLPEQFIHEVYAVE